MGTVKMKWVESQLMVGVDSGGHPLVVGSWSEQEPAWAGAKPSDLLLMAAASCTMYDVVMIMKRQRQPLEGLEVHCTGEQHSEPPYAFHSIHLEYIAKGEIDEKKLARAIDLSEEKYCSVINTLKPTVKVTNSYVLNPDAETNA
jgi:putative redox protein